MAGTKISALGVLSAVADGDLLPSVDISDTAQSAAGTTKRVTATVLSTYMGTKLGISTAATVSTWSSPISAGITIGNGTTIAQYVLAGKLVVCHMSFVLGSSSSITGAVRFTLPVTAARDFGPEGNARIVDAGTALYRGIITPFSTTVVELQALNASATYATGTALSSTVPMTWASTDSFDFSFTYLAA